eukprot:scaffold9993_cov101-Isochrysis_galbana.AAC.8
MSQACRRTGTAPVLTPKASSRSTPNIAQASRLTRSTLAYPPAAAIDDAAERHAASTTAGVTTRAGGRGGRGGRRMRPGGSGACHIERRYRRCSQVSRLCPVLPFAREKARQL